MEDLSMATNINNAGSWLVRNQSLLINYIVHTIAAIAIIIGGIILAREVSKGLNRVILTYHIDNTITDFVSALARYAIIAFSIIAALGCVGVQTASIITVLGAAGLAVGLALQGLLANFAVGLLLVILRPFRAGEYVDLGGTVGTVLNVQVFFVTLRSPDGKILILPNKKVIDGYIANFSREQVRRNEFIISVDYNSDIKLIKNLLINILKSDERILKDREIVVCLNKINSSSIDFVVHFWSKIDNLQTVYWDVLEHIKHDFDTNSIHFSHSQINTNINHIKKT